MRRGAAAAAALGFALFVPACGDGSQVRLSDPAQDQAASLAAQDTAREYLENGIDPIDVVADRQCQTSTVGAYNTAEAGASEVTNLDPATIIWVCDFDVVLTGPPAIHPMNYTPPAWPASGKPRIARVVLLPGGGWQGRFYEEEPPPLI